MKFSRMLAIPLRQLYLLKSSSARIMPLIGWVTIDMVLWGFMTKFLSSLGQTPYRFVPALLGAVLFWDFMTRVMFGVTTAFFEDVWSRNFLNVFSSPITVAEYICGLVTTSIGTSLVALATMVLVATAAFGLSFTPYGLMLAPFMLVLFLFGIALGVTAIAIVLRLGPAAEWFVWPMPALLAPFCAVYYPLTTLPAGFRWIALLLPPSYVFEGMRAVVSGEQFHAGGLAIAFALSLVYILIGYQVFARVFRHAIKTGLIARYSAETLN